MVLGLHVATSCQKKDGEIEKLKRDLADTESSVSHAKQMWLRESTRAALIMDQVEGTDRQRHTETDRHAYECVYVFNTIRTGEEAHGQGRPTGFSFKEASGFSTGVGSTEESSDCR